MDSLKYDGKDVFITPGKRLAIIDSASVNIQLPQREFKSIKKMFLAVDPTIDEYFETGMEGPVLVSNRKCQDLMKVYSDIQFALFKTIVVLKPRGYLYSIDPSSQECTIGIQAIPDSLN